ncbi:MAG: efflux RND transporter periplasmic adaptor subunit [Anaerolineales bacterium]
MAKTFVERFQKFIRKRWIPILVGIGVILVVFFFLQGGRAGNQAAGEFQTAILERGNLTATIGATGSVRANQSATLNWETPGVVEEVNVLVGHSVGKDDILASLSLNSLPQNVILAQVDLEEAQNALALDAAETAKALAEAQSALEDAERDLYNLANPGGQVNIDQAFANMVLAKDKLDKAREDYEPYANRPENNLERANLLLRFTEAQQEYDSAVRVYNSFVGTANSTDIAIAEGQVALAQGQLEIAQRNYDAALSGTGGQVPSTVEARLAAAQATVSQRYIEAPFAGVVTDAFPTAGDVVTAGQIAFQLDDLERMLVDVDVSEVDINRVEIGQAALITFDSAPETEYRGKVVSVAMAGTVVEGAVNFRVTVELSDPDEFVRPGMTAGVNIVVTELESVLLLPNRAVRVLDGERVVYVLREGQLVPVVVTLGASSETYSEVLSGDLQEGETIVLNPPAAAFDPSQPPQGGGGQFLIGN